MMMYRNNSGIWNRMGHDIRKSWSSTPHVRRPIGFGELRAIRYQVLFAQLGLTGVTTCVGSGCHTNDAQGKEKFYGRFKEN